MTTEKKEKSDSFKLKSLMTNQSLSRTASLEKVSELFKFLILGAPGVGKTALVKRFIEDRFDDHYATTAGVDYRTKTFTFDDRTVKAQLWDTGNLENLGAVKPLYYIGTHAVIVVFDITNRSSYLIAKQEIKNYEHPKEGLDHIILVATKSDLQQEKRVVSKSEIAHLRKVCPHISAYIETSSKNNENVEKVFNTAVELILKPSSHSLLLARALNNYIKRIDSYKKPNSQDKQPNFHYGFWCYKNSQAINREANYYLAKQLLKKLLESNDPIEIIFDNIDAQRNSIIKHRGLAGRVDYKDRGINSSELNKIIKDAMRYSEESQKLTTVLLESTESRNGARK